ncbi:hypothetical protein MNAN1_001827 [Malassezia nana]|uniref:C2H2-type domain-containing protein n=1 Tax=Malassezia nana TaxID=180528 RepID=A0AAF0EM13_9BASI|nr:hypothetical protein MNAN1_001827 [Malassezia nana]
MVAPGSLPSALNSQTFSPKIDALPRTQFLVTAEEEYIQNFMGTALKELENETSLQDASNHPGMGLLLSLSDKLTPAMHTSATNDPGAVSLSAPSQTSSGSEITPPAKPLGVASPVVPTSLPSPASPLFSLPCTPFDHSLHLDTIASAASEAAATQYKEATSYPFKSHGGSADPASGSLSSPDKASYSPSSSSAYLYMLRQTALKDAKLHASTRLVEKAPTSSPVTVGAPSTSAGPDTSGLATPASMDDLPLPTQPTTPLLEDELQQQQVIEDAVRKLNAHHQLAQSAALRHHEAMGMRLPTTLASKAPLSITETPRKTSTDSAPPAATKRMVSAEDQRKKSDDTKSPEPRTQDTQKRFQCPKCSRAFARAYNLNTHLSTHDPDPSRAKPFPCPYRSCRAEGGRSFSRKHDLQRHVASVHEWEPEPGIHGDTGEVGEGQKTGGLASLGLGTPGKKFRCEQCGRGFVRRDALRRHHCERAVTDPSRKAAPSYSETPAYAVSTIPSHLAPHADRSGNSSESPATEPLPSATSTSLETSQSYKEADANLPMA